MADDELSAALDWADRRLWPKARGPFMHWYATERPGPAGWGAYAAFAATDPDHENGGGHDARTCDSCTSTAPVITLPNPGPDGEATGDLFDGMSA